MSAAQYTPYGVAKVQQKSQTAKRFATYFSVQTISELKTKQFAMRIA